MPDEAYMYWLSTLYALGSQKQNRILEYFGDPREAFEAPPESLRMISGFTENNVRTTLHERNQRQLEYGYNSLERAGIHFISRTHPDFPSLLAEIPDPPIGLFYIGSLPDDTFAHVAVIGSRRCSEYGLAISKSFSYDLAQKGVVVVSGMARGIDGMAHRGALEGGGFTVAVLGCGVDICYPSENWALRNDIVRSGCIVSEYPPGVTPQPYYFPARNRIISGLSKVVVVVEATLKSGTQLTVNQALDQGRDIMAVPGNITTKYSAGTNALIQQGAEPATCPDDILCVLSVAAIANRRTNMNRTISTNPASKAADKTVNTTVENNENAIGTNPCIAPEEKLVYDTLTFEPCVFDEIVARTNSQPQTIQYILTSLELKGLVEKRPGMRYLRKR